MPDPHLQFLQAEERATATLMGFYQKARLDLELFIASGNLSKSDAVFYRQLLDETNRIASRVQKEAAEWASAVVPAAQSAGWRTHSDIMVPSGALEALSKNTLGLITQTTDGIRETVRQSIAQGILQGWSTDKLTQSILASGLTNIPHWPTVEYRAGVIARTETMGAYNAGAVDGMVGNGARFARWIASPDEATCKICLPRDDVVYRIGGAVPPGTGWGRKALDPGAVDRARSEISNLTGQYPDVRVNEFNVVDGDRFGGDTTAAGTISLYQGSLTPGADERMAARNAEVAAHNDGLPYLTDGTAAGVTTHEFGHALGFTYGGIEAWVRANKSKLRTPPSTYGDVGRRPSEVFAEAFTAFQRGDDSWGIGDYLKARNVRTAIPAPDDVVSNPYPGAQPLPHLPAHPRCRCTVRAEYRDRNGKVIRQGTADRDPKLPSDAMGGDMPGKLPPSVGEIEDRAEERWAKTRLGKDPISNQMLGFTDGRTIGYEDALNGRVVDGTIAEIFGPPPRAPKGGDLAGFEFRLKELESFVRKVKTDMLKNPTWSAQEGVDSIHDLLRYTSRFNEDEFVDRTLDMAGRMKRDGWKPTKWAPKWEKGAYQGVNTNWTREGVEIEMQFHTPESFQNKSVNHDLYRELELLPQSDPTWQAKADDMAARFNLDKPPGWDRLLRQP